MAKYDPIMAAHVSAVQNKSTQSIKRLEQQGKAQSKDHGGLVTYLSKTTINMKSIIFWDVTPCSLLSCNRRFGGTYRLHLQGRRKHFSKNQQVSRWQAE
jgi:hypothetical protein